MENVEKKSRPPQPPSSLARHCILGHNYVSEDFSLINVFSTNSLSAFANLSLSPLPTQPTPSAPPPFPWLVLLVPRLYRVLEPSDPDQSSSPWPQLFTSPIPPASLPNPSQNQHRMAMGEHGTQAPPSKAQSPFGPKSFEITISLNRDNRHIKAVLIL